LTRCVEIIGANLADHLGLGLRLAELSAYEGQGVLAHLVT
jgi:hypothetical protein